jgi:hypothetical protein
MRAKAMKSQFIRDVLLMLFSETPAYRSNG